MDANGADGEGAVAVIPVPASVAGCRDFKMSLSGTWDFTSDAPLELCRAGRTKGLPSNGSSFRATWTRRGCG